MKYLLNIFDLDGTLVDSHVAISMAMNGVLREIGLPEQDTQTLKRMIGRPIEDMMKACGIENIKKGIEIYRSYYFQYIKDYQKVFPGIKDILDSLKNKVLLAVATNKSRPGTLLSLEGAGLAGYFDIIVTESEIKHLKPDPDSFGRIIKFFRSEGKIPGKR